MILTITLNPSIDISTAVTALIPEHKLRCNRYEKEVGGGGINVAKGLERLGLPVQALFFAGGKNGAWINERLIQNGLKTIAVTMEPETRENFTIMDQSTGSEYRLVNKGPKISAEHETDLLDHVFSAKPLPKYIVVSGSAPDGLSTLFFQKLSMYCVQIQAKLILDLPADLLKKCLKYHPFLIKPNLKEFLQLIGKPKLKQVEIIQAAKSLVQKKQACNIAISLGNKGGILINDQQVVRFKSPPSKPLSTVGAGDSMVAGMTYQFYKHESLDNVLRLGLACGTAATLKPGTKLFEPKDAWKLYNKIT